MWAMQIEDQTMNVATVLSDLSSGVGDQIGDIPPEVVINAE